MLVDEDGKEHIFIVQDESAFHGNDYQNVSFYLKPGQAVLRRKSVGG